MIRHSVFPSLSDLGKQMCLATLTVDNMVLGFGHAWVHMQSTDGKQSAPYCARAAKSICFEIFDPRHTKPAEKSWKEFLIANVDEFGTFLLSAYLENMARVVKDEASGYQWVIATLDDVFESEETIELHGKAVVFDPKRI